MAKLKFKWKEVLKVAIPLALIAMPYLAPGLVNAVGTALTVEGASAATVQAVGQAAISGATTAAMGGKPADVAKAALGGFVGSEVSSALPADLPKPVSSGISSAVGSLASGKSPEQALQTGLISGLTSAVLPAPAPDASLGDVALYSAGKTALGQGLNQLFKPSTSYGGGQPSGGGAPQPSTSVTTTGAGTSPGSSALAQALRTDLGAPIFGGDKETGGTKSGWNIESLRYMGNSGEA
jgi:hypothetical protein